MIKPEFNGKRFAYPGKNTLASGWDVLRWAVTRKPAKWPRELANPPPSPVLASVDGERLRITYINHATVLIQAAGMNLITDPVFSKRVSPVRFAGPKRHRKPGISLQQLPPVHAILVSHTHYDHLDIRSIQAIAERDKPTILAPLNNADIIRAGVSVHVDAHEMSWWDGHTLSDEVQVQLVPARHWTSRQPGDQNKALWGGFVIRLPGGNVYFAGDTGYGDGLHFQQAHQHCGPFRCALLPIGAYEPRWFMQPQHMNPAEAVQACTDLQCRYALGIHHGTFQLTDEAHDAPVRALADALREQKIDPSRFRALGNGEAWDIPLA